MTYETTFDSFNSMTQDLDRLLRIPSVSSEDPASAGKALDFMLSLGQEMGFVTKKVGPDCGHIEFGEGEELAAVLCHVDVVPAGNGWSTEPFALTEKNGRYYGRGVVDDKGPAMAALYALKALKDSGVIPRRRLRLIIGASEEIGMHDMETYFASEEMPCAAFTPDSDYGICVAEKGILQIEVSSPYNDATLLTEFCAGRAINAVPDKAYALVDCTETEDNQLRRYADAKPGQYDFLYTMDGLRIDASGKAAHASTPEAGLNAATHLIRILAANFGQIVLGSLCSFLDDAIGLETDGSALGISCSDKPSGALTVNVGRVEINDNICKAFLDVRYPVTADSSEIVNRIRERASYDGLRARVINHELPLFMEENAPVIALLRKAYQTVCGEPPALYATGGGTYARTLQNRGVAFGPAFPDDEVHIHDADESISVEHFRLHTAICTEALRLMAEAESLS